MLKQHQDNELAKIEQPTLNTLLSDNESLQLAVRVQQLATSKNGVVCISSADEHRDHEHFALEIAQMLTGGAPNKRVLLIDVNFDAPSLHEAANMQNSPGLWELLENKSRPNEAPTYSESTGLYILPAGKRTSNLGASTLVSRFEELLNNLKEPFSTILFCLPNINSSIESELVLTHSDSAVVVVRAGATSKHQLLNAKSKIEQFNTELFGVMLAKHA